MQSRTSEMNDKYLAGHLHASFGTHFSHQGKLSPITDKYTLRFAIDLSPILTNMDYLFYSYHLDWNKLSKNFKVPTTGIAGKQERTDWNKQKFNLTVFKQLFQQHNVLLNASLATVRRAQDDISVLIPNLQLIADRLHTNSGHMPRSKRYIGMVISAVGLAMKGYSMYKEHKFRQNVFRTLTTLGQRHDVLGKKFLDFKSDMMTVSLATLDRIVAIERKLNNTRITIQSVAKSLNTKIQLLDTQIHDQFRYFTAVIGQINHLMTTLQSTYAAMEHELSILHTLGQQISDGLIDLANGRLSQSLVPPAKLADTVNHINNLLAIQMPQYECLLTDITALYNLKDTVSIVHNNTLLITMYIPLAHKKIQLFDLFLIDVIYVPFDLSVTIKTPLASYTRLHSSYTYLAITDTHYSLFDSTFINFVDRYMEIYVSKNMIIQTSINSPNCEVAIFLRLQTDVITSLCDFQFYHDIFVPASIHQSTDFLLFANISPQFRVQCEDSLIPSQHLGFNFAVIATNDFCHCSIQSSSEFVPPQVTACPDKTDFSLEVRYTHNSIVALEQIQHGTATITAYSFDYIHPEVSTQNVTIPDLFHQDEQDVLFSDYPEDGSISVSHLFDIMNKNTDVFLTSQDRMLHGNSISNWATAGNSTSIIMMTLSILGSLTIFIVVIIYCKYNRISTLVSSLLIMPNGIKADQTSCVADISYKQYILGMTVTILLFIAFHALKYLYRKLKIFKIMLPASMFNDDNSPSSDIYLELNTGQHRSTLYIGSYTAPYDRFPINPILDNIQLSIPQDSLFPSFLNVNWNDISVTFTQSDTKIILPSRIYIPLFSRRSVGYMMKQDTRAVRILIAQNNIFHTLGLFHKNPRQANTIQQSE
jgi:hypothetical protein